MTKEEFISDVLFEKVESIVGRKFDGKTVVSLHKSHDQMWRYLMFDDGTILDVIGK